MDEPLCPDASTLIKIYVPETGSAEARQLVLKAIEEKGGVVGPAFVRAEVLSTLRRSAYRGAVSLERAAASAEAFLELPIEELSSPEVYRRAWELAVELDMPTVYDAVYLAVAELQGATFWTADRKLHERAKSLGYVRVLGEQA